LETPQTVAWFAARAMIQYAVISASRYVITLHNYGAKTKSQVSGRVTNLQPAAANTLKKRGEVSMRHVYGEAMRPAVETVQVTLHAQRAKSIVWERAEAIRQSCTASIEKSVLSKMLDIS